MQAMPERKRIEVFRTLGEAVTLAGRRPVVLVPFLLPWALLAGAGVSLATEALGAVGIVFAIGAFIAFLWAFPATIVLVGRSEDGEPVPLREAAREGLRRLPADLLLLLLLGGIFLVALGLPGLLVGSLGLGAGLSGLLSSLLGGLPGTSPGPVPGTELGAFGQLSGRAAVGLGATAFVGLVLLGLWGLFLTVKFSLSGPALVLKPTGPLGALGEGWRRSRGAFFRLLGLFLLVTVTGILLELVLGLIPVVGVFLGAAFIPYLGTAAFTLAYRHLTPSPQGHGEEGSSA